ncbi:MAG TPA: type II toxin-antitoxin system RelE/ParE family toxin [Pirellulales bacterium]|nr:type II toxin-antitoxin system RelE/ParE family toxin [Pirellulales bacterium]
MALVVLTPAAQEQFDALPKAVRARIERILRRLERWPEVSGAKPLSHDLVGRWRMRTGDYRVQFYIEPGKPADEDSPETPGKVKVDRVGHRDGFYDGD